MNLLDKAIAYVSPRTAAQRARYRMAAGHFDAAGRKYRQKNWQSGSGDANAVNFGAIDLLRKRSRDLCRNNPIARRAISVIVDSVVGDGIIPSIETDDAGLKTEIEAILREHLDTTAIDASGRLNLYGLQRLAMHTIVEGGEILWLRRTRRPSDGLPLNLQIQTLESEYLDDRREGLLPNGNSEYDGIELDMIGRRVAYRLFRSNPEAHNQSYPESRLVKADSVIHGFRMDRAEQRRGTPWLAPVMARLHDLNDYADAQLLKQKIAAMWVAFTVDQDPEGDPLPGAATDAPADLVPGMFEHLPPGRDVRFSEPPKVDGYPEVMREGKRDVAAGLDLTYESMTMDMSSVSFISGRLGRLEMNAAMSAHQWTMMIPQMCQPLEPWLRDAIAMRVGDDKKYRFKWTPPRFPVVDPNAEVDADTKAVEGGFTSRQRVIRRNGFDPEEIDREIAEDAAKSRMEGADEGATE